MAKKDKDKEKESSIIETREQELPEIEIVGKDKRKKQTYDYATTEADVYSGTIDAGGQGSFEATSEDSGVIETRENKRAKRQRDVGFGEGLAKAATIAGLGGGNYDRVAAREQRAADRRVREDAREAAREERMESRLASRDALQAVRDERMALRDERAAERERVATERRDSRLAARDERQDARIADRQERINARTDAREGRIADRAMARQERAYDREVARDARVEARDARVDARNERIDARNAEREARANEAAAQRAEERATRYGERVDAREERREARQEAAKNRASERATRLEENVGVLTGKPQGLRRLDAPTTDAPTEVPAPADKAPAAKTYGVTTIEEPNVTRRPSGEGGTTAEQREITDAEAREMRGYTGGESAAANGQGAERKVTYIEEPNVQRRPHVDDEVVATEDKPISDEDARKIRGYGDNVVDHTTAREIPKATSVYDIEKERQAKRDAEKAIADYDAKEYVRVMDSLKPKHDPVEWKEEEVPIIEDIEEEAMPGTTTTTEGGGTTTTTEGGGEPQGGNGATGGNGTEGGAAGADAAKDAYMKDVEWFKKQFGIDDEAEAKRKKAAKWAVAAQMLADSIAALSNVYWVGKGANSMTLNPGAQRAADAANKMYADIAAAREKALKAALDEREKQIERAYRAERDRKQDEKDARVQENWKKTFDANEAYRAQQQKNFEKTEARLAEQARLNAENERIRIDIAKQNANIQLKNALDKNKPYPMAVNGEIYEIPIKKVNEQIIGSIFAKLPEEVRNSAGSPRYGKDAIGNSVIVGYDTPSLADMLAAIGTYGNDETAKEIMKLAGVKVEEVEKVNSKKEDKGSSRAVENVGYSIITDPIANNIIQNSGHGTHWGVPYSQAITKGEDGRTVIHLGKL